VFKLSWFIWLQLLCRYAYAHQLTVRAVDGGLPTVGVDATGSTMRTRGAIVLLAAEVGLWANRG
jgi:hypothetical protein